MIGGEIVIMFKARLRMFWYSNFHLMEEESINSLSIYAVKPHLYTFVEWILVNKNLIVQMD